MMESGWLTVIKCFSSCMGWTDNQLTTTRHSRGQRLQHNDYSWSLNPTTTDNDQSNYPQTGNRHARLPVMLVNNHKYCHLGQDCGKTIHKNSVWHHKPYIKAFHNTHSKFGLVNCSISVSHGCSHLSTVLCPGTTRQRGRPNPSTSNSETRIISGTKISEHNSISYGDEGTVRPLIFSDRPGTLPQCILQTSSTGRRWPRSSPNPETEASDTRRGSDR